MFQNKKIAAVVPAYNEEGFIASVIGNMPDIIDRIYVVDDASTDKTGAIVSGIAGRNGRTVLLSHERNRGVGAAIVTGYKRAQADGIDIAVVMAGDNQMDGAALPLLLDPVIQGKADYSKGNRMTRISHLQGMSPWRRFGNFLLSLLTKIASGYWRIGDPQNGYTAISLRTLRRIELDKVYPRYGYPNDMLIKLNAAGCVVVDVPIPARYGKEKSKIQYSKFITTVAPLLLRGYLWRLKTKYFSSATVSSAPKADGPHGARFN